MELRSKYFGPESKDVASSMMVYAKWFKEQNRFEESKYWYTKCLDIRTKILSPEHPDVVKCKEALNVVIDLEKKGKQEAGEENDIKDKDVSKLEDISISQVDENKTSTKESKKQCCILL
jgi:hypothetical protein